MKAKQPGHYAALWIRRVSVVILLAAVVYTLRTLPAGRALEAFASLVEDWGLLAPLAFVAVYAAATVLMLPGSPLSLAAGAIFGLATGTLVVAVGATLGMAGAFLVTRHLARGAVEARLARYPRFAAVDRAVGKDGWKIVALLRLSPAFPFNLQNYAYGLTSIRFWPCVGTSAIAILPGTFMYVYLGYAGRAGLAAAADGGPERGPAQWALLAAGLAATVAVTVYVARIARRAVREARIETETVDHPAPAASWPGALLAALAAAAMLAIAIAAHGNADRLQGAAWGEDASGIGHVDDDPPLNNQENSP